YLLTDEKGTRPLKTRAELERDLKELVDELTADASLGCDIHVAYGLEGRLSGRRPGTGVSESLCYSLQG
ncbi:MAG: hypothetical protein RLP45_02200, partial [Haliea sp.]